MATPWLGRQETRTSECDFPSTTNLRNRPEGGQVTADSTGLNPRRFVRLRPRGSRHCGGSRVGTELRDERRDVAVVASRSPRRTSPEPTARRNGPAWAVLAGALQGGHAVGGELVHELG